MEWGIVGVSVGGIGWCMRLWVSLLCYCLEKINKFNETKMNYVSRDVPTGLCKVFCSLLSLGACSYMCGALGFLTKAPEIQKKIEDKKGLLESQRLL